MKTRREAGGEQEKVDEGGEREDGEDCRKLHCE